MGSKFVEFEKVWFKCLEELVSVKKIVNDVSSVDENCIEVLKRYSNGFKKRSGTYNV